MKSVVKWFLILVGAIIIGTFLIGVIRGLAGG